MDVKLPGMVHARNVKPPVAGAKLISIDESSVRNLPGLSRVVSKATTWRSCANAKNRRSTRAKKLKVNWEKPATAPFPSSENLFNYMREVTPKSSSKPIVIGNPETAFAARRR